MHVFNGNLDRALKVLKKDFDANVRASLRRHAAHVGPGERRRVKARAARKRVRRDQRRQAVTDAQHRRRSLNAYARALDGALDD